MKDKLPVWAIVAVTVAVLAVVGFSAMRIGSGPQLPSDYDPNAPIGSRISPPAGFEMPKTEPAPPPPPAGVSMNPPMPTSKAPGK